MPQSILQLILQQVWYSDVDKKFCPTSPTFFSSVFVWLSSHLSLFIFEEPTKPVTMWNVGLLFIGVEEYFKDSKMFIKKK
jgi:hypothetical protein